MLFLIRKQYFSTVQLKNKFNLKVNYFGLLYIIEKTNILSYYVILHLVKKLFENNFKFQLIPL